MTKDKIAKNLLQDKTCDSCEKGPKNNAECWSIHTNTCKDWEEPYDSFRIYSTGTVGLGTVVPSAKLHIKTVSGAEMTIDDDGDVELKFN